MEGKLGAAGLACGGRSRPSAAAHSVLLSSAVLPVPPRPTLGPLLCCASTPPHRSLGHFLAGLGVAWLGWTGLTSLASTEGCSASADSQGRGSGA